MFPIDTKSECIITPTGQVSDTRLPKCNNKTCSDALKEINSKFNVNFKSFDDFLENVSEENIILTVFESENLRIPSLRNEFYYGFSPLEEAPREIYNRYMDPDLTWMKVKTHYNENLDDKALNILNKFVPNSLLFLNRTYEYGRKNFSEENDCDLIPKSTLFKLLPGLGIDYTNKSIEEIRKLMPDSKNYDAKYVDSKAEPVTVILVTREYDNEDTYGYTYYTTIKGGIKDGPYIVVKDDIPQVRQAQGYAEIPKITVDTYHNGLKEGPSYAYDTGDEKDPRINGYWYNDVPVSKQEYDKMLIDKIDEVTQLIPNLGQIIVSQLH